MPLFIFWTLPAQTKGLDEDSEATLLTALKEILDNVDDENLSPFDTLPDSDLLSGQKAREHSPVSVLAVRNKSTYASRIPAPERGWKRKKKLLTHVVLFKLEVLLTVTLSVVCLQFRRLLCLSRSPPERETLCNGRPSLTGKVVFFSSTCVIDACSADTFSGLI